MRITITSDDGTVLDVMEDSDIYGPLEYSEESPKDNLMSPDIDGILDTISRARDKEVELEQKVQGVHYEEILISNYGLIYSKGEGKVTKEWARAICGDAGINYMELKEDVWHKIPLRGGKV